MPYTSFSDANETVFINSTTITRSCGVVVYLIASNLHNLCDKQDAVWLRVKAHENMMSLKLK